MKNVLADILLETADVPSWNVFNNLILTNIPKPAATAFTHIVPYLAAQYDTIFTCMVNFQDVMVQDGQQYGSLWYDEGIYRLAKELQLLLKKKKKKKTFGQYFYGT